MKFRKPPVIEVWISLDFEPNEKKQHFDPELVKQYLKPFREELPRGEVRREREFTMQTNSPNELPETVQVTDRIQHFRQWDEARSQLSFSSFKSLARLMTAPCSCDCRRCQHHRNSPCFGSGSNGTSSRPM